MNHKIPEELANAFRLILKLDTPQPRLDIVLMNALKQQNDNEELSLISKARLKKLFTEKKVLIKGQSAKAKSPINSGITYIDILI